jgi:hypothetical protein
MERAAEKVVPLFRQKLPVRPRKGLTSRAKEKVSMADTRKVGTARGYGKADFVGASWSAEGDYCVSPILLNISCAS